MNETTTVDTSFKGVERLLRQMAFKGYQRLVAAKIMGADLECVFGEMQVGYVKALNGYRPETGRKFTTYCVTVCWNEFNKYAERLSREQQGLGYISTDEISQGGMDDDFNVIDCMASMTDESPEDIYQRKQDVQKAAERLSKDAKFLMFHLLSPNEKLLNAYNEKMKHRRAGMIENPRKPFKADDISISFIADYYGMARSKLVKARRELGQAYGIEEWRDR